MAAVLFVALCGLAGGAQPESSSLSEKEQTEMARNWQIAYRLVDYDRYSWIASDTAMAYQDSFDLALVKGWIVIGDSGSQEVIFGGITDTGLISPARVRFTNGTPLHIEPNLRCFLPSSPAFLGFKALDLMKTKHLKEFEEEGVPMNSYVLFDADTITVYFFPGSTDQQVVLGGGYRRKYLSPGLKVIEDRRLHGSPIYATPEPSRESFFRTSSKGEILNEVDLAQFIIYHEQMPKQLIMTPKYIFTLSWDALAQTPMLTCTANR